MKKNKIRIGCGAGFSGDRLDPAVKLVKDGELDYLVLECLAERTIALAQKRKMANPELGYDPLLEARIESLLPLLLEKRTVLISNMGAANPVAAGKKILEIAANMGLKVKVAVVSGDDVVDKLSPEMVVLENGKELSSLGKIISGNAYLGVEAVLPAFQHRPDIIITGRVADPSLFLAPMVHEFGWDLGDYSKLGKGTVVGHLLECAGQLTGGYFAEPVMKPIPGMENLGHPYADIFENGECIISKVEGTGGEISVAIAKEQLLYEVINPFAYLTPDVEADFSSVSFSQLGKNKVSVKGGGGKIKPEKLKVSVGYEAGWLGEGEISYAGVYAKERGKLAGEIINKRIGELFDELKVDLIGINSLHSQISDEDSLPYEVRLRIAGKSKEKHLAERLGHEVEALYTNGPAGGGGARKYITQLVGIVSILLDREKIKSQVHLFEN
ncbi:acyclic terpene utilization AtuA family protein [Arthrospiribacter ruber]|uniref:DUF1446 domain-containing protein n=1 Tax=Arthrospiribacter ruber TaxID=2487934 RepID=A0A951MED5_9BACT|nr:acyclic terpene utilization AtuA family protein [Arthrospiribacter ruber]MBW3468370.1 DUF1446 domain-containing protein [Arthrospiribacter ruber]